MRTFETTLLAINLLSLFLHFKKQSKSVWLWSTGINLAVLFLHCIFEGPRYQMAFSYVFVILLLMLTFVKIKWKFETPKALKIVVLSLSLIFLVFTGLLAYALPVFRFPKPTGDYAVGIQYFHLIDESRMDPFLNPSTKKRELMIKIYYPSKEDDTKPFSPYFHNSRELLRLLTTGYNLPAFLFDHFTLVKTNSKDDLQLSNAQERYPIILFSHGAGTSMETQTSQSEDLASHGYIVVAIDHTYTSAGTIFPDHIVSAKEATANFNVVEPAEIITQIMANDSSFVIDQLTEMNEGKPDSSFRDRLNLEKIGAMGHSVGGAVAYNLAINDRRVRASIDLDGVVYVTPKDDPNNTVPFLMLASDRGHIQAIESRKPLMKRFDEMDDIDQKITLGIYGSQDVYEDAYNKAQQNVIGLTDVLQSSGNLFTIEGCDHMKFTDIGLFIAVPQLRELIGIVGKTDPARCLEITKAITLTFFDNYLNDDPQIQLVEPVQNYPELKRIELYNRSRISHGRYKFRPAWNVPTQ